MENIKIYPSQISGEIKIPSSKSQTQRALLFSLLAKGKSVIKNALLSPDTFAMIEAIKKFGAKVIVKKSQNKVFITSPKKIEDKLRIIDAKNSGLVYRFIAAISSLQNGPTIIYGDDSIEKNRIISPLLKGLNQLNVKTFYLNNEEKAPILIKAKEKDNIKKKIFINGQDSQTVSSLIILAIFLKGPLEIFVKGPKEGPWIDLTLSWLDFFNVKFIRKGYKYFKIFPKEIKGFEKKIEQDFSSMYYPIVLSLFSKNIDSFQIKKTVFIKNVDLNAAGGDKKLLKILQDMGANIKIDNKNTLFIQKSKMKGKKIDANDFIDCTVILAVLACFCEEETVIFNAKMARKKESDRIFAICNELKKMGAHIKEKEDGLIIKKTKFLNGANLCSHKDHRVALSLIIAALLAKTPSILKGVSCIEKSFPNFINELKKCGAKIEYLL